MKLIPLLLFISVIATSAKAETSYEAINCSWAGSIIILTVPMDTSWNFQKKEEDISNNGALLSSLEISS